MFTGTHTPRLDEKSRLALPARQRSELEDGLVICKGQDRCLYVFPLAGFQAFTQAIAQAPITDRRVRNYGRTLFAGASAQSLDGQGRITIPAKLREYANLTKDCTVVGVNNRLEVWDSPTWDAFESEADQAFADIAEEVLPGIF